MNKFNKISTWLLILFCIINVSIANAQSRISSVYGVNLGDTESVVASKVSGTWKTNKQGKRYYFTSNPKLGNCTFQQATFNFTNGKLSSVIFSSGFGGGGMDPNFQGAYGAPNAYDQFLSSSQKYQQMYTRMVTDLSGKYGSPMIDDGSKAIWKSNGNSIEVQYDFDDNIQYGFHNGWTRIAVTYSVNNSSSSNF